MAFKVSAPPNKRAKLQAQVQTKLQAFAADEDDDAKAPSDAAPTTAATSNAGSGTANPMKAGFKATATHAALGSPSVNALKEQGSAYAESGDFSRSLKCWDKALQLAPHDAAVHEMRSQVLNEMGDAWGSVQAAANAVSCSPQWPDAHLTLARARRNFGEPALALQSFDAGLALMTPSARAAPEIQEELQQLRMLAVAQQRHQKAVGSKGIGRATVVAPGHMPEPEETDEDEDYGDEGQEEHNEVRDVAVPGLGERVVPEIIGDSAHLMGEHTSGAGEEPHSEEDAVGGLVELVREEADVDEEAGEGAAEGADKPGGAGGTRAGKGRQPR